MRRPIVVILVLGFLLIGATLAYFVLWHRNPLRDVKVEGFARMSVYEQGAIGQEYDLVLEGQLQDVLRTWIDDDSGWTLSFTTFSPHVIVYVDECTINFTGSRVVCNCGGKQLSRGMNALDHELKRALMQSKADLRPAP